jgi:hypothetical protein
MTDAKYNQVRHVLVATAVGLGAAVALLWFWNVAIHELFDAPRAQFRHALATIVACCAVGWTLRAGAEWLRRSSQHR